MSGYSENEYVYGFHAVSALIRQSSKSIINIYLDKSKKDARTLKFIDLLEETNLTYEVCHRDRFQKLLGDVVHQGVLARIDNSKNQKSTNLNAALKGMKSDETILILDCIQDPVNLGGCLRSADAAGIKHVILPKDKNSSVTAVARKVAAGAADSLYIYTITNLVRIIELLKQHDFWIIGMADEIDSVLYDHEFKGRVALVMGNEGKGLRRLTRRACDHILAIPMQGQVESLNVAVATGVTLFEVFRQRNA